MKVAPTPPATSKMRSQLWAKSGKCFELPRGPSMLSGGFAFGIWERVFRAVVVGPLRERRTSVMSFEETEEMVKGLKRKSWIEGVLVFGGVEDGGMERYTC